MKIIYYTNILFFSCGVEISAHNNYAAESMITENANSLNNQIVQPKIFKPVPMSPLQMVEHSFNTSILSDKNLPMSLFLLLGVVLVSIPLMQTYGRSHNGSVFNKILSVVPNVGEIGSLIILIILHFVCRKLLSIIFSNPLIISYIIYVLSYNNYKSFNRSEFINNDKYDKFISNEGSFQTNAMFFSIAIVIDILIYSIFVYYILSRSFDVMLNNLSFYTNLVAFLMTIPIFVVVLLSCSNNTVNFDLYGWHSILTLLNNALVHFRKINAGTITPAYICVVTLLITFGTLFYHLRQMIESMQQNYKEWRYLHIQEYRRDQQWQDIAASEKIPLTISYI